LAPVPTGLSPLAFIVKGVEPGDRVDSQGTITSSPSVAYLEASTSGAGINLLRARRKPTELWPFKYEGQPDNCGIFGSTRGGCVNNVGSPTNLGGLAPGGGDADIAVNAPDPQQFRLFRTWPSAA